MRDENKTKQQLIDEVKILRWSMENMEADKAERKRLEESLHESKDRSRIFFNANPHPIMITDIEGVVVEVNEACAKFLDKGTDELTGLPLRDIFPEIVADKRLDEVGEVVFTGREVHFEDSIDDRHYHNHLYPIFDDRGLVSKVVIFSTDITERKYTEKALDYAEWKYRHTLDIVSAGIFQTAPDGHFVSANNALARIYGYASPEDLIQSVTDITKQHYVDKKRRSDFIRLLKQEGIVYDFKAQMYRKDKTTVWVSINARAIRDKKKRLLYYEGAVEDISRRKRLEAQLVQSQRTETIGKLAGGIAHNFNNLLTSITGNFELLLQSCRPRMEDSRETQAIRDNISHGLKLCEELLSLSRRQLVRPVETDMGSIVVKMEDVLRYLLGEDIICDISIGDDLKTVKVDPSLVEQIILMLAVNAREAMPQGGTLRISVENTHITGEPGRAMPDLAPGEYLTLIISDTGAGMTPDIRARIFEPFFSIKPDGTGLGLSIVHSIVHQSGGSITVESGKGKGTAFTIFFPILQQEETIEETVLFRPGELISTPKATILVVEDESGILYWVTDALEGLGYTVLAAFNSEEATIRLSGHEGPVDLLITDLILPGKSGLEVAAMLKEKYPAIKIIFMSGYGEDRIPEKDIARYKAPFLSKPFTPLHLLMKVEEVLGR